MRIDVPSLALWLAVSAAGGVQAGQDAAIELAYRGHPGQKLTYQFTFSGVSVVKQSQGDQKQSFHGTLNYTQQVLSIDRRGHRRCRLTFGTGDLITSAEGSAPVRHAVPLSTVELIQSETGNVLSVEPLSTPSPKTSGDDRFASLFTHLRALAFPGRPVRVGDSWSLDGGLVLPDGKTGRVIGQSRLIGIEERSGTRCGVVQTDLRLPLAGGAGTKAQAPTLSGTSVIALTTYFALEAGCVLEVLGTERATGTVKATEDAGASAVPIEITTTFTLTLKPPS